MPRNYLVYFLLVLFGLSCGTATEQPKPFVIDESAEKIWAHRFNDLEGAESRLQGFDGIEIDIYFLAKTQTFEVKHDLDSTGIELTYFLDSIIRIKPVKFWFDYKNLNENPKEGVSALTKILVDRNLQDRCLIESSYPDELMQFNSTISTSFWVSYAEIPRTKIGRDSLYHAHFAAFQELKVTTFSTSFEMFDFMQAYFPNRNCNYWMSGNLSEEQLELLREMADKPNVNVILVDGNRNFLK